jgi:hypothetical protein
VYARYSDVYKVFCDDEIFADYHFTLLHQESFRRRFFGCFFKSSITDYAKNLETDKFLFYTN